jgi:uracil-DNA glycosylase family 4
MEVREGRPLCHDGGKLLTFTVRRLSIGREDWVHTYCYDGLNPIPTKKFERRDFLAGHIASLLDFLRINQPCVVVGLGKLTTECLIGVSLISKRVGTYWRPTIPYARIGVKKVWIAYNPDAALYDPLLYVDISRVIGLAAIEANIPIKIDHTLPMFDWTNYL